MSSLLSYYLIVPLLSLFFFVFYLKWKQNYWTKYGIRQYKGALFFGSMLDVIQGKEMFGSMISKIYELGKSTNEKHAGSYLFLTPLYVPVDLTVVKNIMVKDFHHFTDHGFFNHPKDILSMNLFSLGGEPWKKLRQKLTPTFSSGKMKMMFEKIVEKANNLEQILLNDYANKKEPLNIKDIPARFTTDVIGSCAFGIDCNSLEDPDNEFRLNGTKVSTSPPWRIFLLLFVPWSILGNLRFKSLGSAVTKFYIKIAKDVMKFREENNVIRNDFMQLLLELKNKKLSKDANEKSNNQFLTEEEIIAQCFVIFFAGFDTSSTTLTFALYELAQHEDIQKKLRENINQVLEKYNGKVTYDSIREMDYLDKVVNETLRKYPSLTSVPRVCNKTYHVPGTDVIIEKGNRIRIPIWAIHKDPEYYPNPEIFDPERFSEENIKKRPDFSFLPFGEGPRMCIGLRFGVLQVKVGLISLIKNFKYTVNEMTKNLEYESGSFVLCYKNDVWLNIDKI